MKKGWKIFWIVIGSVAILGFAFSMVALGLGVTGTAIAERFPNGIGVIRNNVKYGENGWGFREKYSGDATDISESYNEIRDISVQLSAGTMEIKQSDTKEVKLETRQIDSRLRLKCYVEDGELIIETRKNIVGLVGGPRHLGTITLYLPKDFSVQELDIELGAGKLFAEQLRADSLSVDVGAGEANINEFRSMEADFSCGAGRLQVAGEAESALDVECGVGDIQMQLEGKEQDYNYELNCGIGSIELQGQNYSGLGREKELYNNGSKQMNIECGIGTVKVSFSSP